MKTKEEMAWEAIKAGIGNINTSEWTKKFVEQGIKNRGVKIRIPVMSDIDLNMPADDEKPIVARMKTITERELQALEEERDRLRGETTLLAAKNRRYAEETRIVKRQLDVVRGMLMELQDEHSRLVRENRGQGAPAFIKKYLKFIIFACHPDRNPGRQEAGEVTKELLKLRGK